MAAWARIDVLLIDDLALRPLTTEQAADVLEVIEDRTQRRSTIITSQLPIAEWHEAFGDPTLADAILDRITNNAHRIELRGDSMRKRGPVGAATTPEEPPTSIEGTPAPKPGRGKPSEAR